MRYNTISKLIFICVLYFNQISYGQQWIWGKQFGSSTGYDGGYSIKCDKFGNAYVAGGFENTINFGTNQFNSAGLADMFFIKLDSTGTIVWAKQFGGVGYDYGYGLVPDASGNYYLAGTFNNTIIVGADTIVSAGGSDIMIAKLDSNLNVLWTRHIGGTLTDDVYAITIDSWNNLVITFAFQGITHIEQDSLVSNGSLDFAVAKFDSNGSLLWDKSGGSSGIDGGISISTDLAGNIYIGGQFQSTISFGGFSLTSAGQFDALITKLDSGGNVLWIKKIGGTGQDGNTVVRVNDNFDVYVAGVFEDTLNFNTQNLISQGLSDIFIVKCDTMGDIKWAREGGSISIDIIQPEGMCTDGNDGVILTGYYGDTATFGNITFPGYFDIFALKYDSAGKAVWARTANGVGGIQSQIGNGVAVSQKGGIFLTGSFQNELFFDSSSVSILSAGFDDVFVAKISQPLVNNVTIKDLNYNINVYPIPASDILNVDIQIQKRQKIKFSVLNIYGVSLLSKDILPDENFYQSELNLSNMSSGIYFIRFEIADQIITKKIVKL
jgi:hypothetical protein